MVTPPQGPITIGSFTETTPRTSFTAMYGSSFSTTSSKATYSLENSWILDPGADIHVCNNDADFRTIRLTIPDEDVLIADHSQLQIEVWGDVMIKVDTPIGLMVWYGIDFRPVDLAKSLYLHEPPVGHGGRVSPREGETVRAIAGYHSSLVIHSPSSL